MTRVGAHLHYRKILRRAKEAGREREAVRDLAKRDLFFLLRFILDREDIDRDWLYYRCREVQWAPDGYLDLWARRHYKTTIITFAKTIQDILLNPEITAAIFSWTRPLAKDPLSQIKRELERNQKLKELFPDILWENPQRQAPKWNEDDGIIVKRKGNPRECTLEAWGLVDGQPVGPHYSLRVYDDIVTKESVTTPEMLRKVLQSWELSLNLASEGGKERYIGTRYHANDTYKSILDRGAARLRKYPATIDGTVNGQPVLLTSDDLQEFRKKMGPYVFGSQMLLDPVADDVQAFKPEWIRYWMPKDWGGFNRYILVDPASSKKKSSDYTVMAVIGLGEDQNYYLLDGIRDRLNLTERASRLIKMHRDWAPITGVGYEQYGMQADIEHIRYVQDQRNYRFEITPLAGKMKKEDRIRRLIPIFEQKRFHIPPHIHFVDHDHKQRDFVTELVEEEYPSFPVGQHDDILDAISRIEDEEFRVEFPMTLAEAGGGGMYQEKADSDYDPYYLSGRRR